MNNTNHKYGNVAQFLHWSIAFVVIGLLALGLYMEGLPFSPEKLQLYNLHKSFGFLVLFFVVLRILWRMGHPPPPEPATRKKYEMILAGSMYAFFYVALIVMPLSGWIMSAAADFPMPFFGLFTMPDLVAGQDKDIFGLMRQIHGWGAYLLIAAIMLHVAAGFKHQFFDHDRTLNRMLPQKPWLFFGSILAALILISAAYNATYMFDASKLMGQVIATLPDATDSAGHNSLVEAHALNGIALEEKALSVQNGIMTLDDAAVQSNDATKGTDGAKQVSSWSIVEPDSSVTFSGTVENVTFEGKFGALSGDILFDPDNLTQSRVNVSVDVTKIDSGSYERDEAMKNPLWFAPDQYPVARFEAKDFILVGTNQYEAKGALTIRDVTLPLTVPFNLNIEGDVALMTADFAINRIDFGVGQGDWVDTKVVANEVMVTIKIKADRK
jgi:cytochrome b561/polyisoprenoid-binding protein YceI